MSNKPAKSNKSNKQAPVSGFELLAESHIHGGVTYKKGDTVPLTARQVARMPDNIFGKEVKGEAPAAKATPAAVVTETNGKSKGNA